MTNTPLDLATNISEPCGVQIAVEPEKSITTFQVHHLFYCRSAVFNILMIIALTGALAGQVRVVYSLLELNSELLSPSCCCLRYKVE